MDFGNCGGEGHGVTTCTNKRGALAQDDSLKTATYDGRKLRLNGEVLGLVDERRKLVVHIVVLPGVTAIHDFAIYGCTSISSVTLPEGLTEIGEEAFEDCTSLASVTLPEGLTKIGNVAFRDCSSLSSVALPEGLTTIGNAAFDGCTAYLRIFCRANRRYAVLASLARLRDELYARQAKRARHQAEDDDAVEEEEEEEEEEELEEEELEEEAGVLRGELAFDVIHSDDLWRHILEFV